MIESMKKHIMKNGLKKIKGRTPEEILTESGFTGKFISVEDYVKKYGFDDDYELRYLSDMGYVLFPQNDNLFGLLFDVKPMKKSFFEEVDLEDFIYKKNVEMLYSLYGEACGLDYKYKDFSIRVWNITKSLKSYTLKVLIYKGSYIAVPNCYKRSDVRDLLKRTCGVDFPV